MSIPKYAKFENERRFLVIDCPDLSATPPRLIEDIYLADSRLRLRAITHIDGMQEFKLCKKYESEHPQSAPVVNVYLSAQEHAMLSRLPGRPLRKRRHRVVWNDCSFGLDVFEGSLAGLILCEIEAESPAAIRAISPPPWTAREVTDEPFFTGGSLAHATAAELGVQLVQTSPSPQ